MRKSLKKPSKPWTTASSKRGEFPMAIIIDGKEVAAKVRGELKVQVDEMVRTKKRRPCLAVILVGEDPASKIYVRNKQRACAEVWVII